MLRSILILSLFAAAASLASGQQRPLITDDIDITPQGAFELGVGVDFYQNAKFPLSGLRGDLTRVGDIRLKTGMSSNVELQIEGTLQNFLAINSQGPSGIPLTLNSPDASANTSADAPIELTN